MKYTCDIMLTDSKKSNPSDSVEYEYFVRAKDTNECLRLIHADLQACEPDRNDQDSTCRIERPNQEMEYRSAMKWLVLPVMSANPLFCYWT